MAFWVYGRDRDTRQPDARLFSDAESEEAARAEAESQGIAVERVEPHLEAPPPPATPSRSHRPGYIWICLTVAEIASLVGCVAALFGPLAVIAEQPLSFWWALPAGVVAFCYNVAMLVVFSQAKEREKQRD
jgi:hypothetical protein